MNIHFISGLPRSGSTLLANILSQNPKFHATATSGMVEVLFAIRNKWDELVEHKAMEEEESEARKQAVLLSVVVGYHNTSFNRIPDAVLFDRNRGHLAHIEMLEWTLQRQIKVLVPVRDVRDVLASMELRWRDASKSKQVKIEAQYYMNMQTVEGRCEAWSRFDQPVGMAYNRVKDAIQRGFRDRMFFVRFEDLTSDPKSTMMNVHEFLEEEQFEYDFDNVEQVTEEDDRIHGMDLHQIRSKVEPVAPRWPQVLGRAADKYGGLGLW